MRLLETISISAYSRLSDELGDGLTIIDARLNSDEAAIVQEHVAGLLAVPAGVLSKLRAHGLARVQIGKGGVASFPGYRGCKGVQIPTAPRGVTWNHARGAYIAGRREVILGTGSHGYSGTATHEIGHALGHLLSYDLSEILQREYKAQLNGTFGKNSAYYPNSRLSATGCKEFFAETVGLGILSPDALRANFSRDYYEFIMKVTLQT